MDPQKFKPTDPVRLVNNTDTDIVCRFQREKYKLGAGETVFWPWEVACTLLGDPTLRNTPVHDHGDYVMKEAQQKLIDAFKPEDLQRGTLTNPIPWDQWKDHVPDIETYGMDGERVLMAFERPYNAEDFQQGYTETDMKMRVAELEMQLANMRQSMEHDDKPFVVTETAVNEDRVATFDELPEDGGPKTKPNRRVPDEIG